MNNIITFPIRVFAIIFWNTFLLRSKDKEWYQWHNIIKGEGLNNDTYIFFGFLAWAEFIFAMIALSFLMHRVYFS
jgi:hypothetical protein